MTVLFHAPTSIGLGHVSRALAIAEALRAQSPDLPIIISSELPNACLLEAYPYPYYLLPAADILTYEQRWQAGGVNKAAWQVHYGMFQSLLAAHKPSLVVFDTFYERELHQMVQQTDAREVMVLRSRPDMLDMMTRGHDFFTDLDLIIFPHDEYEINEPDLEWVIDPEKIVYAGPVTRPIPDTEQREALRQRYRLDAARFIIVVSNGGGISPLLLKSDYDYYLETVLKAFQQIDAQMPPYHLIVISGPLHAYPVPRPDLDNGRLTMKSFEAHLTGLYTLAQMAITRGGYNTRSELARIGTPALSIPLRRSQDNQSLQLQTIARQAPNITVGELSVGAIAAAVLAQVQQERWQYAPLLEQESRLAREVVPLLLDLADAK